MFSTNLLALTLTVTVIWISMLVFRRYRRLQLWKKIGIPGPEPSLFAGNYWQLRKNSRHHEVLAKWVDQYGDLVGFYVGDRPYLLVNDIDLINNIMVADFDSFVNRSVNCLVFIDPLSKLLPCLKDSRWREVRAMLTPIFSPAKMKHWFNIIQKKIDITVDIVTKKAEKKESADVFKLCRALVLDIISDCTLSLKTHCQRNYKEPLLVAFEDMLEKSNHWTVILATIFPFINSLMTQLAVQFSRFGSMFETIYKHVHRTVAGRKMSKQNSNDFLNWMLDYDGEMNTSMNEDEVVANSFLLLVAALDPISITLGAMCHLLATHTELQEKLFAEVSASKQFTYDSILSLSYLDQVWQETLRLYPPSVNIGTRICGREYKIGKYIIPEGVNIQVSNWNLHHDPQNWPNPWEFRPERFCHESLPMNKSYIPFGMGPRNCIGLRLAEMMVKLILARLLSQFRIVTCKETEPLTFISHNAYLNPINGVYLRFESRN